MNRPLHAIAPVKAAPCIRQYHSMRPLVGPFGLMFFTGTILPFDQPPHPSSERITPHAEGVTACWAVAMVQGAASAPKRSRNFSSFALDFRIPLHPTEQSPPRAIHMSVNIKAICPGDLLDAVIDSSNQLRTLHSLDPTMATPHLWRYCLVA